MESYGTIILFAFITVIAMASLFFTLLTYRREQLRSSQLLQEVLYRVVGDPEELQHLLRREQYREGRYLPEMVEQLPYEVRQAVRAALRKELPGRLREALSETLPDVMSRKPGVAGLLSVQDQSQLLIRELSHALFTPLSQIEAAVVSLSTLDDEPFSAGADAASSLDSIRISVEICKSMLAAFREQMEVARAASSWSPSSLVDSLKAAGTVYEARVGQGVPLEVDMPESLEGYSNNYVLGLLLPLLENAIEASREGATVSIVGRRVNEEFLVEVTNESDDPPESDQIYENRFTSKEDHEGTGLTIVQHLLAAHRGASVSHRTDGNVVTFALQLPGRRTDGN